MYLQWIRWVRLALVDALGLQDDCTTFTAATDGNGQGNCNHNDKNGFDSDAMETSAIYSNVAYRVSTLLLCAVASKLRFHFFQKKKKHDDFDLGVVTRR